MSSLHEKEDFVDFNEDLEAPNSETFQLIEVYLKHQRDMFKLQAELILSLIGRVEESAMRVLDHKASLDIRAQEQRNHEEELRLAALKEQNKLNESANYNNQAPVSRPVYHGQKESYQKNLRPNSSPSFGGHGDWRRKL